MEDERVDECARLLYLSDEEAQNDYLKSAEGRGDELVEEMLKITPWEELEAGTRGAYHRRAIVVIRTWGVGWRSDLDAVPLDRDFLIKYEDGRVTVGQLLDNLKTGSPFRGIRPARSLWAEKAGDRIVGWMELPL